MAVKGSRSTGVGKVKYVKPGQGSGKRTQRFSPQFISKFKNEVQKQKSKANLAVTASYNKYTNKGTVISRGGQQYSKGVVIIAKSNLNKPTIKVVTQKRSKPKNRKITGSRKLIRQVGRY